MKHFKIFLFLILSSLSAFSQDIPAKPNPPKLVTDFTNTLSADQKQALENKLVAFDDSTSNQIAIVIISSTGDYDISDYTFKLGNTWGIGNKVNNGVLILVAKDDRKIFIAPGYGLEGALPDITCAAIIDNEIKPNFKENDFYRGLDKGIDAIIKATKGEYKAPANYKKKRGKDTGGSILGFVIILFIILMIVGKGGGGGGMMSRRGYSSLVGPLLWGGLGRSSGSGWGGGGSSGGGGFGGFGGGSFGGGGSGGSW